MNVVGFGTGTKSMMSLWLLYPSSLARCFCLLRLTKKMMNPIVQASRTQAPETDPAIIGVFAFCLDVFNVIRDMTMTAPEDQPRTELVVGEFVNE